MSDVTINVTVSQGGTIDADLSSSTVVNTSVEPGGQIAAEITGGGQGPPGPTGPEGPEGPTGPGVPNGGSTAQVLRKASGTDQDTEWHTPVKADVGLGNVDNTSDANKPISSATQTALDAKVTGPASVTDDLPAVFDGTTGKLLKSKTYAAFKTLLALVKGDVGLGNADNTADSAKNVLSATKLTTARNIDGQSFDGQADITVIAPGTHAATGKTTPVDADEVPLVDSAASNVLKKLTWANLKATLKTYFDTLYQATGSYQPLNSNLTTIAGLTPTTDNFMVANSSAWASRTPSQARTHMGLGSLAVLSTVTEADITLADNTTNNFSTTKHGFVPKGTNTGKFLKDDGTWDSIPGGGDMLASTYDPATIVEQVVGLTATQTLTNKRLTSPKINENVAVTATATEINVLSGIPATLTSTELGYIDGVTSAIQTQLGNKQPLDADLTTIAGLTATTDNFLQASSSAWASRTPAQAAATLAVEIGKLLYPVGSYYSNETDATNPATLLGFGTWTAVADKFLVGRGATYTSTGGAATHTHPLSDAGQALVRISTASPYLRFRRITGMPSWTGTHSTTANPTAATDTTTDTAGTALAGSTDSGSTIPPYQAVYVWKRTA